MTNEYMSGVINVPSMPHDPVTTTRGTMNPNTMSTEAKNIIHIPVEQTNDISDGYHTFGELYEHRVVLWVALCKLLKETKAFTRVWRSKLHADGTGYEGWFLLCVERDGEQMSYHLPESKWGDTEFAETLEKAEWFDGHTSADVLERIAKL